MKTLSRIKRSKGRLLLGCICALGTIALFDGEIGSKFSRLSRQLAVDPSTVTLSDDGVCLNYRLYPTLHDKRSLYQDLHRETFTKTIKEFPLTDRAFPQLRTLENANFCIWNHASKPQASAWTNDGIVMEGPGWIEPPAANESQAPLRTIEGSYVAFFSWFQDQYGHFLPDSMPTIAWIRATVPSGTKFILLKTKTTTNVIKFLDPEFFEEVVWIDPKEIVHVNGTLTVMTPDLHPVIMGNNLMNYFRKWIREKHPDVPYRRLIVFYTRGGSDTHHGRVLEAENEQMALASIQQAMKRFNRTEELIMFDGRENGSTMPIEHQFAIFRSASVIIGPHGSGLANMVWANPHPTSCEDRTQVLEFLPGPDADVVQHGNFARNYYLVLRGFPLDYHHLCYTAESTAQTTYINIDELNHALDSMWGGA